MLNIFSNAVISQHHCHLILLFSGSAKCLSNKIIKQCRRSILVQKPDCNTLFSGFQQCYLQEQSLSEFCYRKNCSNFSAQCYPLEEGREEWVPVKWGCHFSKSFPTGSSWAVQQSTWEPAAVPWWAACVCPLPLFLLSCSLLCFPRNEKCQRLGGRRSISAWKICNIIIMKWHILLKAI